MIDVDLDAPPVALGPEFSTLYLLITGGTGLTTSGTAGNVLVSESGVWASRLPYYHGQGLFARAGATSCSLTPKNGNKIIINGQSYTIPSAGVTFRSNATTLEGSANTTLAAMATKPIGPSFADELKAAGLTGLPFSWGSDGVIQFRSDVPLATRDAVMTVYAAHNPATPAPTSQRDQDLIDARQKIDDIVGDGTLPAKLRVFVGALKKVL